MFEIVVCYKEKNKNGIGSLEKSWNKSYIGG